MPCTNHGGVKSAATHYSAAVANHIQEGELQTLL